MSITITNNEENFLENKDICFLNGSIDDEMADYVIRFLLERQYQSELPKFVKLIVSSTGGGLEDALGIIDTIKGVDFPVYTYGLGKIYSAGLLIFISGTKGNRYIFKNTSVMSHQWTGENSGKQHDLKAAERGDKLINQKVIKIYESATGLSVEEINNILLSPSDAFLSPSEAVKYHLADKIIKRFD